MDLEKVIDTDDDKQKKGFTNYDMFNEHNRKFVIRKHQVFATSLVCPSLALSPPRKYSETCRLRETWKDGRFEGGDDLKTSAMENRQLRTLRLQKVRTFQGRNLELVTRALSLCIYVGVVEF